MKRDLRINYANLKYIQRQLIQYVDEICSLSTAANAFLAVIQVQDSDAYKKLRKHWSDKVISNADMLSGRLEQVAENLKGYIGAMTTYISPMDESQEMRVDRNDIWFNYIQIGTSVRDYWDIFGDRGSSWENYRRCFWYNPFESEEANENRRSRMRSEDNAESDRRKRNFDKLQNFRDEMFRSLSEDAENYIRNIRDIHQNNVIPYENTDDEYCKKLHELYKGWADIGDVIRDNWNERLDFYRGVLTAVIDMIGGIVGLQWNISELQFYAALQIIGIVPKWMQNDMDRLEQSVILLFTDPGQAAETIGQKIFDTADEEGIAFSVGYVIVDIAAEIFVSKGLKKLKAAKMADNVADAAEDLAKHVDDVVDAAEDLAKYEDVVVDAAGDLTRYAEDVADTAEDLAKYVEDVADTAEDLAKHADDVTDAGEDILKHVDNAEGGFGETGGVKEANPEIDLTIMSRNHDRGNPSAITHFGVDLNERQKNLLQQLPYCDSSIIINKGDVNLKDLAALTAETGDEFAMFTRGSQRMVVRGNSHIVNVDGAMARELYNAGFRWSGHTHPGNGVNVLLTSPGDEYILEQFNQSQSVVLDGRGNFRIFWIGE